MAAVASTSAVTSANSLVVQPVPQHAGPSTSTVTGKPRMLAWRLIQSVRGAHTTYTRSHQTLSVHNCTMRTRRFRSAAASAKAEEEGKPGCACTACVN